MKELKTPYETGYDCGTNGPNTNNCNFRWFATGNMTKEWERGKKEAQYAKVNQ